MPMLHRSAISSKLARAAPPATNTPVSTVATCGVLNRGWVLANCGGNSPSRDMARRIRGCPSWKTSRTAVWATTEPKATTPAAHGRCTTRMATESGSAVARFRQETMPVVTAATTT